MVRLYDYVVPVADSAAGIPALPAALADLPTADRKTLLQRRDALLAELAQLEARRRDRTIAERAERRRLRILNDLERIYAELDATAGPRGGGEGIAA